MSIEITKMSQNGQIVIPSEIRKSADLKPSTQFLVINQNGNILLKKVKEEEIIEDLELLKKLEQSEKELEEGKGIELDSKMSPKEIDKILMGA